MSNILSLINTDELIAFLLAVVFLFALTIVYVVQEYIRMKLYAKKVISYERLSMEIINVMILFSREKKAIEQYPTLHDYVKGINPLFNDYLLNFRKARIIRNDRPKDEMMKFREEYRQASTQIQKLVQRYAELLKNIYRTKHPIRFLFNSLQINAKIYYTLFRLAIHLIVTSGIRLLFSFTLAQQKKRFEYARVIESITENSEIKIAENSEINYAA